MAERGEASGVTGGADATAQPARVGFRIGPWSLAAPVESLLEVRHLAPMARVPGVRPWLLGVSNVHGHLLPIVDLGQYLLGAATVTGPACRLLVAARGTLRCGLLVEEVHALTAADPAGAPDPAADEAPGALAPCLGAPLDSGGETWLAFDVQALLGQPGLASAAAPADRAGGVP